MTLSFAPLPCPNSPLRRIDPRWKLAGALPVLAGLAAVRSLPAAVAGLALSLLLAALACMPWRWYLSRIAPLGLVLAFLLATFPLVLHDETPLMQIGGLPVSWSGLQLALLILAKAIGLVTLVLVVLIASPLNDTLTAAHALRVPGLLIQITLMAYQHLHLLTAEARRLRIALRVRAFRNRMSAHSYRTMAHVAGAILVRGHERAERMAHAMRCRGFRGRFQCLQKFQTRWTDVAFFLLLAGAAVAMMTWDWHHS